MFIVDANFINYFQKERIGQCVGMYSEIIEHIKSTGPIIIDAEGHCKQEWVECAGGRHPYALEDWISDLLLERLIKLHDNSNIRALALELRSLGVPQEDQKWLNLAANSKSSYILSDDIDFFDPTQKKSSERQKNTAKRSRNAPVRRCMRRNYNVEINCCAEFYENIS